MIRTVRVTVRASLIAFGCVLAMLHFSMLSVMRRRALTLKERAHWLHFWCGLALKILRITVECQGELPGSGLLVANHLSYVDIVVFSALVPAIFVAKAEVRSWPLFGTMARLGGSIFIDRWKLRRLPTVIAEAENVLRSGALLIAFPEATTTNGTLLLPFRPALFEAAVRSNTNVTASYISYTLEDGSFAEDMCWWGDVELIPHLIGVFSKKAIRAHVRVGSCGRPFTNRKPAAATNMKEVMELAADADHIQPAPMLTPESQGSPGSMESAS